MTSKLQSMKLSALQKSVGPAMRIIDSLTSEINPTNSMAQFIDENMEILFRHPTDDSEDLRALSKFLVKLLVLAANDNPDYIFKVQAEYHNQFSEFYSTLIEDDPSNLNPNDES